jgi:hypothetical protein
MGAYQVTDRCARPGRDFVAQWMYNTTSAETSLHVAQLDSGPGYADLVRKIHQRYGQQAHLPVKGGPENWDILYPVSPFIESQHFPITTNGSLAQSPAPELTIKLVNNRFDEESGYRILTIEVTHVSAIIPCGIPAAAPTDYLDVRRKGS